MLVFILKLAGIAPAWLVYIPEGVIFINSFIAFVFAMTTIQEYRSRADEYFQLPHNERRILLILATIFFGDALLGLLVTSILGIVGSAFAVVYLIFWVGANIVRSIWFELESRRKK